MLFFMWQEFYWDAYHIVREQAPYWLFLMHDSFNYDVNTWGDFMKNCPTIGLDTHIYQVQHAFVARRRNIKIRSCRNFATERL